MTTATAYQRLCDRLTDRGLIVHANGTQTSAHCPAHEDRDPSLSVTAIEGSVLVCCHGRCETVDVMAALGLGMADLYDTQRGVDYRYDNGRVVHRKPDKTFRQSNTDRPPELYRLARVRAAVAEGRPVAAVEGEKDVHAVETLGLTATCSPMGAGKAHKCDWAPLAGANVVIVADRDDAGEKHAGEVLAILRGLDPPAEAAIFHAAAGCKDAADHVAAGYGMGDFVKVAPRPDHAALHFVSLEQFAAEDEDGTGPLLGEADQALIAENSDVVIYGDGGAGKSTLMTDLTLHWDAGVDWLGIEVPRQVTVGIIENEGPRALLRLKMRRKLAGWTGTKPAGRARILEQPWAGFTFADEQHRRQLAESIRAQDLDVVIVGPVVCAGMDAAGTLTDVREFLRLLADVRRLAGRRITFVLIHHENRAGKVSGAWEGAVDTLIHVTGMGPGRTRLHVQKARWASAHHARTLNLAWTTEVADGYRVEDKPEMTDDDVANRILAAVAEDPGITWTDLERATPGIRSERRRAVRDRLLELGQLVNIGKQAGAEVWLNECPPKKSARLHLPDDPTIRHLRPDPDADRDAALLTASG